MMDTTDPSDLLEAVAPMAPTLPHATNGAAPARLGEPNLPPRRPRREGTEVHRMVVGQQIKLSGSISACDQLVVEGTIEADIRDCDDLQIAQTGLFRGTASIGEADIRGRYEGMLVVRTLIVRATAKVTGKIRYVQLQIERGGQISGDVVAIDEES